MEAIIMKTVAGISLLVILAITSIAIYESGKEEPLE